MAFWPKPTVLRILSDPTRTLHQSLILVAMMIIAVAMLSVQYVREDWRIVASQYVVGTIVPITKSISYVGDTVEKIYDNIHSWIAIKEHIDSLEEENSRLRYLENRALELESENRSLRALLNFPKKYSKNFVSARVFADTGGYFSNSLLLDAGAKQGVKEGDAVLSGNALSGRISTVSENWSRVILINDPNSMIPVISRWNRERALLSGNNSQLAVLKLINANHGFSVGQQLVTSGEGFSIPPDIPVAVVENVKDKIVTVRPIAEPRKSAIVSIVNYSVNKPDLK